MPTVNGRSVILIALVLLHTITAIALLISMTGDQSNKGPSDGQTAERFADQMSQLSDRIEPLNANQQQALIGYCRTMGDNYLRCTKARESSTNGIDRLLRIFLGVHISAIFLLFLLRIVINQKKPESRE